MHLQQLYADNLQYLLPQNSASLVRPRIVILLFIRMVFVNRGIIFYGLNIMVVKTDKSFHLCVGVLFFER